MTNYKNLVKQAIKAFIETCGGPLTNIVVNALYNGQLTFAQSLREVLIYAMCFWIILVFLMRN